MPTTAVLEKHKRGGFLVFSSFVANLGLPLKEQNVVTLEGLMK